MSGYPKIVHTEEGMRDVFAQRNTNRTVAQQMAAWPKTIEQAQANGATEGCMSISNAFGSNWTGDVSLEQLMHMLEEMGIDTGVDLYKLIEAVWLAEEVVGHQLFGFVSKAGPRPRFDKRYAMDMPHIETLSQARHFILGSQAYAGAASPWKERITSYQRPEAPLGEGAAGQPASASVRLVGGKT